MTARPETFPAPAIFDHEMALHWHRDNELRRRWERQQRRALRTRRPRPLRRPVRA